MPPEERRELRLREGWRQQRLKREAEEALRQSGLQLEAERQQSNTSFAISRSASESSRRYVGNCRRNGSANSLQWWNS